MVLMLPQAGKNPLAGLVDNATRQANTLAFNIQFNNLQNTIIDRFNKEAAKIANTEGNQRELDDVTRSYNKSVDRRNSIVKFAFSNEANNDRHGELATAINNAFQAFTSGDGDINTLTTSEITAMEAALDEIVAISDRLIELNHPEFVDGNNVTNLRSELDSLLEKTAVEGIVDPTNTGPQTNDNRAIYDLLDSIESINSAAQLGSATLEASATEIVNQLDTKLTDLKREITEINVFRAGEIEYEIQILKSKHATFLRSIELAFDNQSQQINGLVDALNTEREIPKGSILSILT